MLDGQKPRRRWFQFSLRTLLIGVLLVSCYLGWQARIVARRKAVLANAIAHGANPPLDDPNAGPDMDMPWIRRMMGDKRVRYLIWIQATPSDREKFEAAFPETKIIGW